MTISNQLTLSVAEQTQAIEAIARVKSKYSYNLDHRDWDGFVSLFAPDGLLDLSDFPELAYKPGTNQPASSVALAYHQSMATSGAKWPIVGREAIRASVSTTRPDHVMVHHVFSPDIELTSDTTANAVSRLESHHWLPVGAPVSYMHNFGSYHETYSRLDDGQWYIQTLKLARLRVECS